MNSTAKIALGILGAAVVGAAIGMLLAPQKGSDLRKYLRNKAGELADGLGNALESGKEQWSDMKNNAKGVVADAQSQV